MPASLLAAESCFPNCTPHWHPLYWRASQAPAFDGHFPHFYADKPMNRRPFLTRAIFILAILLLILNVYVFFTREWESSFYPASYATIYYPLDNPAIKEWKIVQRNELQLDLACSTPVTEWRVLTDGASARPATGMQPVFLIDTTFSQLHTYTLVPIPEGVCQTIEITIRFYPKEFYHNLGMERPDVYIVRSNVACGEFEQYSISDWTDDYGYVPEEDLARVDSLLRTEVGIHAGDPTLERMEKLYPYLRKHLKGSGGVPKDDERWMNPYQLYCEMVGGTGKGWCTQNAQVWVFWANRAGIPTRFVFGARTQDNTFSYSGHSWAECYVREQRRWAFVDLANGHMYITDRAGQVLNTVDLFELNQRNAFDSTLARMYVDWQWTNQPGFTGTDTTETVPYGFCNSLIRDEFSAQSIFKYRRPPNVEDVREIYAGFFHDRTFLLGNLNRYLFKPPLAYSLYPTEGAHTYFVRRLLFFAFLASLLAWVVLLIRNRF
jgi:hypothetical protein